jgi:hypothetical protein
MQFLKAHWITLACGLVALLAIGFLGLGMTRKNVVEEMSRRVGEASEIDSLKSSPKNQEAIDAEVERGKKFEEEYNSTVREAERINKREPLRTGVFPVPASDQVAYNFQELYQDKLYELPRALLAGGPPTPEEVQDEVERLAEAKRRKDEQIAPDEPSAAAPGAPPSQPPGAAPGTPPPEAPGTAKGSEAELRAAIRKARNIRMYAEMTAQRSCFHISPIVQLQRVPPVEEMWEAQVGLWVQQDVVNAIRKLNDEAAEQLPEKDRHVEFLPVKRLLDIRVFGYVSAAGQLVHFGASAAIGGGGVAPAAKYRSPDYRPSFTGRKGDENFDVITFGLAAVIDQRDVLRLGDRITRENFYQLTSIQYDALPPGSGEGVYFYGGAPVVLVTMNFEGYMARKAYKEMMPPEVLRELGAPGARP